MKQWIRTYRSYLLLAISLACFLLGIYRNEVASVYQKAIRICLECIGIG